MKEVRLPTKKQGDWWIVVHDLRVFEGRFRNLRPVNVLTFLGQLRKPDLHKKLFLLCLALENKLFGVRYQLKEFCKTITTVEEKIYCGHYVREYNTTQAVISSLEAYLNSIYTSLEICAQINRFFYKELPIGFRKQSKKYKIFDFKKWKWLAVFYDLRSELTHYNTLLPTIKDKKICIEFTSTRSLEFFKKKLYNISFDIIENFSVDLYKLLDKWALEELKHIDPEEEIDITKETGWKKPLKTEKQKVKDILKLIGIP